MGVPGLFPFIKTMYPKTIKNFTPDDPDCTWDFDYVYLDSNPLLHDAVRHVYNLNTPRRLDDKYANKTYEEKELIVFERIFDDLVKILTIITPQKVLYIAIDGCAPRAKMNQQRERRFGSGLERHEKEELSGVEIVDTSMITPGTEFMHRFSEFIYWKLREFLNKMQSQKRWWKNVENVTIIYDPPTVPGEGEHKIMNFIRSLPEKERFECTHCMFGPDGDLLFLTLSAHVNKMHLLRADTDDNKENYYNLVNATAISEGLVMSLNQAEKINKGLRTIFDVSNDFTLIGFFVGNDFLPKIKMFHRLNDGLSKLFRSYIRSSAKGFLLTRDNKIIIDGFSRFVYSLSLSEDVYLAQQALIIIKDSKFQDNTLLKHAILDIDYQTNNQFVKSINMIGYRQSYYNKAGIDGMNYEKEFEECVTKMCKDYFKTLVWVYLYYVEGLPSWEQSYKWHYAPLMGDLANYLNQLRKYRDNDSRILEVTTFNKSSPSLPFEQLLSVLSPYSYKLLPKEYQHLILDENSMLNKAGYYPKTFEIDCEGKTKDFQCLTLLPFVNSTVISEAYNEATVKIPYKWHRNEKGRVCTFKYIKEGFLVKFQSKYGTINKCKVKVEEL